MEGSDIIYAVGVSRTKYRRLCTQVPENFLKILVKPANIYFLKVNNVNTRNMRDICSKFTIMESFFINFNKFHTFLVFLLLTLNR